MTPVHLSTPAAPKTAACADPNARRFSFWRRKVTCTTCKLLTAPHAKDDQGEVGVTFRADLPVRYSRLVAYVRAHSTAGDVESAIADFERERQVAARCNRCGPIADPIAMLDPIANRMLFACPKCTTGKLRDQWEAER